jgi:hypothetical protein
LEPFPPKKANQRSQDDQESNRREDAAQLDGPRIKLHPDAVPPFRNRNHPEEVIAAKNFRRPIVYGRFPSRVMDFAQEEITGSLGRRVENKGIGAASRDLHLF